MNIDKMLGKIIGKKPSSGASVSKQKQWKNMTTSQRTKARRKGKDSDGDGVPNKFDCSPRNAMRQDSPNFYGPRRKAGEGEAWVPFINDRGEESFYLKKLQISLRRAKEIMTTPFLTYEEKVAQIKKEGGNDSIIRQASQQSSRGFGITGRFKRW